MSSSPNDDKLLELKLSYAWDWFKHHADQRFSAFNFFLIVVGAVVVAYANAASDHDATLGISVAGLAVVVAVGFLAIDVRNGRLVEVARAKLEELERDPLDFLITTRDKLARKKLLSHSFWFRAMIGSVLLLACAGVVWAAADW